MKSKSLLKSDKIKEILRLVEKRLVKEFKDNLLKLVLYGSYARRDFTESSDIDIFLLMRHIRPGTEKKVYRILYDIMWDINFRYRLSPHILDQERYNTLRRDKISLVANIDEDGVVIWENTQKK